MSTDYKNTLNWNTSPELSSEIFSQSFVYDAMLCETARQNGVLSRIKSRQRSSSGNRPMELTKPDGTLEQYTYNKAGLLETVKAHIRGEDWVFAVTYINYNEKGQRTEIYYGNGSKTKYTYDPLTFRLVNLYTTRNSGNDELQNIIYTYDPVGNITKIRDDAQTEFYFNNSIVEPESSYTYDALYRLKTATGRELANLQLPDHPNFVNNIPVPNTTANAMQDYYHEYDYDQLGNIMEIRMGGSRTREYFYDFNDEESNYDVNNDGRETNQLLGHVDGQIVYTYDSHGNMLSMPHLSSMLWDYKDELKEVDLGGGGTAYYVYDAGGERVRKVIEKTGGIVEERFYLGGYEVYRKSLVGTLQFERETLHVSDDTKKIVSIETKTVEAGNVLSSPISNIRYQYDNHLGSASLELDDTAAIISYEEYHPFGTTSYRSGRTETEVSLKRYKYVGKERDDETGLYYYGARYYAAWICRFVSVDPLGQYSSSYIYCGDNPINFTDPTGMWAGEYYKKDGTYLGADKNDDSKIYTANSVTETKKLGKDGKPIVSKVFNDAEELSITHSEFRKQAATIYGESSAFKMNTVTDDLKKEMFAIASVHQKNDKAYGATSDKALEYLSLTATEINKSKFKTTANAAVINALTGGKDYSNGAEMWDGEEQALKPSTFTTFSSGGIEYHMNTMGWTISDTLYNKWEDNVGSKFDAPQKNFTPELGEDQKKFNKYYTENEIKLSATAVFGGTIFWDELKGNEILKKPIIINDTAQNVTIHNDTIQK